MQKKLSCLVLSMGLFLAACGQSGPLYLPQPAEKTPTKTTQTAVPMGVTGQNQTILSEQPYVNNSAGYKIAKDPF